MLKPVYHILNGDALYERFPRQLEGAIIIFRECFIDIPLTGITEEVLMQDRASYLNERYGGISVDDYAVKSLHELQKIKTIAEVATVNLWFEDDLFCQANFWYSMQLLTIYGKQLQIYLVRPPQQLQYGFAGLHQQALLEAFKNRVIIKESTIFSALWQAYLAADIDTMQYIAETLNSDYPFVEQAVKAHIDRIPTATDPGRPVRVLLNIMNELQTTEFAAIFKEFCKREPIYGFGDVQIKALLNQIKNT